MGSPNISVAEQLENWGAENVKVLETLAFSQNGFAIFNRDSGQNIGSSSS
jgi:hypothetical protein